MNVTPRDMPGMREIRLWVPDTTAPGFAEEYARQARLLSAADPDLDVLLDEAIVEVPGWDGQE